MKYSIVNPLISILLIACLGISACSSNLSGESNNKETKAAGSALEDKPSSKLGTLSDKEMEVYARQDKNGRSNAHVHPASKLTGTSRHVHPNGATKHTHVR